MTSPKGESKEDKKGWTLCIQLTGKKANIYFALVGLNIHFRMQILM